MPEKADWRAVAFSWVRVGYFICSAIFFLLYGLVQEGLRGEGGINPHASGDALLVLIPAMAIVGLASIIDLIVIAIKVSKRQRRSFWFNAYVVHFVLAVLLLLRTPLRF